MNLDISIIMPMYEASTTIQKAIDSLEHQTITPKEIIFVIDGGKDAQDSFNILDSHYRGVGADPCVRVVVHPTNLGLAAAYNSGIAISNCPLVVFMHSDVVLDSNFALESLVSTFEPGVVAVGHVNPAWKLDEARHLETPLLGILAASQYKRASGWNGQFDAVTRDALAAVGNFDEEHFRSAGEDGDMCHRLRQVGQIRDSNAEASHLEEAGSFGWKRYIRKRFQYAEAHGALLRRGALLGASALLLTFWRQLSALALLFCAVTTALTHSWYLLVLTVVFLLPFLLVPVTVCLSVRRPSALFELMFFEIMGSFVTIYAAIKGILRGRAGFLPSGKRRSVHQGDIRTHTLRSG